MKTNETISEETTATLDLTENEATCVIDALTMWNKMPTTWQQSPGREMIEKLKFRRKIYASLEETWPQTKR